MAASGNFRSGPSIASFRRRGKTNPNEAIETGHRTVALSWQGGFVRGGARRGRRNEPIACSAFGITEGSGRGQNEMAMGSRGGQKGVKKGSVWGRFRVGFFGGEMAEALAGPSVGRKQARRTFFPPRIPRDRARDADPRIGEDNAVADRPPAAAATSVGGVKGLTPSGSGTCSS